MAAVRVVPRTSWGGAPADLLGFDVLVDNIPCAEFNKMTLGETVTVDCAAPVVGNQVKIRSTRNSLSVCEVEVHLLEELF